MVSALKTWIEKINSDNAVFDVVEFRRLSTPGSARKVDNLRGSLNRLNRKVPPLRGFAIKYMSKPSSIQKFLKEHDNMILSSIDSSTFSPQAREHLVIWEDFQMKQKGPTAPVNSADVTPDIILPLSSKKVIIFNNEQVRVLNEVISGWFDYLKTIHLPPVSKIQFALEWSKLPNDTVRGFPYCTIGKDVDDEIMSRGGASFTEALKYFKSATQNICFPGWRIQGKPAPEKPKLRLVTIPTVYYQYLVNGLVNPLVEGLREFPCFSGWADPTRRWNVLNDGVANAEKDGFVQIQLDYSKYDQNFPPQARLAVWKLMLALYRDESGTKEIYDHIMQYQTRQFLLIGDPSKGQGKNSVRTIPLPMQLLSGVKDTQITGSLWNGILMGVIADGLGYSLPYKYCRMLGDDAVLPVPKSILDKYGYEGILKEISKILKPYGFEVNPKKAYPNSDVAFLQKLYVPQLGIKGIGSLARALRSFYYRENFPRKIPGIKSLEYLEIISQISILSEAQALDGIDLRNFFRYFADFWLLHDDFLYSAVDKVRGEQGNPNTLFKTLIGLTGASIDEILFFTDSLSYDHTAMTQKLHSSDYGRTFPILPFLLESEVKRQVATDNLSKLNALRASLISKEHDILNDPELD